MKHTLLYIALSAALVGTPAAFAQAPHTTTGNATPSGASTQSKPSSQTSTTNDAMMTKDMASLDSAMVKANAQMAKINSTSEAEEQMELIEEHIDDMEENFENLQAAVERANGSGMASSSSSSASAAQSTRPSASTDGARPATPATPASSANRTNSASPAGSVASTDRGHMKSNESVKMEMADLERNMKQTQASMKGITASNDKEANRQIVRGIVASLQSNLGSMQSVIDNFSEMHASTDRPAPARVTSTSPSLNN